MSKARDLANASTALNAVSPTELGYLDGVTSAVQTQLNAKEATLPSQTGNSGKYLTTDGSSKSWGTIAAGSMTQIATGTLSGASVTISSIPSTYKHLQLLISNIYVTSQPACGIRINGSSSNVYVSGHTYAGSSSTASGGQTSYGRTMHATSAYANYYQTAIIEIPFYANSSGKKAFTSMESDIHDNNDAYFHYGQARITDAVSSLTFLTADGSSFGGGTYTLYGVS